LTKTDAFLAEDGAGSCREVGSRRGRNRDARDCFTLGHHPARDIELRKKRTGSGTDDEDATRWDLTTSRRGAEEGVCVQPGPDLGAGSDVTELHSPEGATEGDAKTKTPSRYCFGYCHSKTPFTEVTAAPSVNRHCRPATGRGERYKPGSHPRYRPGSCLQFPAVEESRRCRCKTSPAAVSSADHLPQLWTAPSWGAEREAVCRPG